MGRGRCGRACAIAPIVATPLLLIDALATTGAGMKLPHGRPVISAASAFALAPSHLNPSPAIQHVRMPLGAPAHSVAGTPIVGVAQ